MTALVDLLEAVEVALDSLLVNKTRSMLTMLGVIIGVAAVVALLSIGTGAQASITERISSAGTNLIVIFPGAPRERGVRGAVGTGQRLTNKDAEALSDKGSVPDAEFVAPEYRRGAQVIFGESNVNVNVAGVTSSYQNVFDLPVASGRFVTDKDVTRRSRVAVLGYQVAQDLFGDVDPVGKKIKVAAGNRKISLKVVGVLAESGGSIFSRPDEAVYVPLSTAQIKLFHGRNAKGQLILSRIYMRAPTEDAVDRMQSEAEDVLRARHGLGPDDEPDFRVYNQATLLETASGVAQTMTIFLGAIAAISLLVGGIGIMNIMLVSVTERTREIGLRKAVGARRGDILFQFLLEAVMLSLLGGVIGVLLGIGIARVVDTTGTMRSVVAPGSIVLALSFSLATGLFFGIYPANKAAGLSPIEALRYE